MTSEEDSSTTRKKLSWQIRFFLLFFIWIAGLQYR